MSTESVEPSETEPAAAPKPVQPKTDVKTNIVEWMQFIRSVLLNGIVIAAVLAVIVFAAKDLWREQVIIEKFGLPETLTNRGLSGAVTANRVWDAMTDIQIAAGTKKDTQSLLAESRQLDVVEPGTGLSLQSATQMFRVLFGVEQTRIGGDIICGTDACDWHDLNVRLRVFANGRMYIIDSGPTGTRDPDQVFHELALEALLIVDPYIVAAYKYATEDNKTAAVTLANKLIDTSHAQRAWAANLIGNHFADGKLHGKAIKWFSEAIKHSEDLQMDSFALPYFGLGNSYLELEDYDKALQNFEIAIAMDEEFSQPVYGSGQVFMAQSDFDTALSYFKRTVEIDPSEAIYWTALGSTVDMIEGAAPALEHLEQARRLDGENVVVLAALGKVLTDLQRYTEAADLLNIVIEKDSTNVLARLSLGRALLGLGENETAVRHLRVAVSLNKHSAVAWDQLAIALSSIGDVVAATAARANAVEIDPKMESEFAKAFVVSIWDTMGLANRINARN